jgi:hypothetical protein
MKNFLELDIKNENLQESFVAVVDPLQNFIAQTVEKHNKVTEIYLQLDELSSLYYSLELQFKHNAQDYKMFGDELFEKANKLEHTSKKVRSDFKV